MSKDRTQLGGGSGRRGAGRKVSGRRGEAPTPRRRRRRAETDAAGLPSKAGARRLHIASEAVAFGLLCLFGVSLYVLRETSFTMPSVRDAILESVKVMLVIAAGSWVAFLIGGKSERAGNAAFVVLFVAWTMVTGGGLAVDAVTQQQRLALASESVGSDARRAMGEMDTDDVIGSVRRVFGDWDARAIEEDLAYAAMVESSGVLSFRAMTDASAIRSLRDELDGLIERAGGLAEARRSGPALLEADARAAAASASLDSRQLTTVLERVGEASEQMESMAGFYALEVEALGELRAMLDVLASHVGRWSIGPSGRIEFGDGSSMLVAQRYREARSRLGALGRAQAALRVHVPAPAAIAEGETTDQGVATVAAPTP
ncbi:MAG: hypothetical protein AAGK04_02425 [Planctomycetota bacterium]